MSAQQAYLTLSPANRSTFSNDQIDDVLLFTSSSNQSIRIGTVTGTNALPAMQFTYTGGSNIVNVQGNLSVTNNFTTCNMITSTFVTSNITITGQIIQNGSNAPQWAANSNTAYIVGSNVAIGKITADYSLDVVGTGQFSSNLIVNNSINTSNITSSNSTLINSTITSLISSSNISASNLSASNAVILNASLSNATFSNLTGSNISVSTLSASNTIINTIDNTKTSTSTNVTATNNQTPANGDFFIWTTSLPGYTTSNATVGSFTGIARYIATRPSTLTIAPIAWWTSRQGVNDNVQFTLRIYNNYNNVIASYAGNQFTSTTFTIATGQSWALVKNESTAYTVFNNSTVSITEVQTTPISLSATNIPTLLVTNVSSSNIASSNITALSIQSTDVSSTNITANTQLLASQANINTFNASNITVTSGATISNLSASNLVSSNITATGNVTIGGNLTVTGTTTTINAQTVTIADNIIQLNSTLSNTAPPSTLLSGIEVSRGTQSNYQFVFQESNQLFKIGQVGSLQAVATRPDIVPNQAVAYWDSGNAQITFDSNFTYSNGTLKVNTLTACNFTVTAVANSTLNTSNLIVNDLATINTLSNTTLSATFALIPTLSNSSLNSSNVTVNTNLTAPLATITSLTSTTGSITILSNNNLNTSNVTVNTNLTAPLATITSGSIATLSNNNLNTSNVTVNTNLVAPQATITTITHSNLFTSNINVTSSASIASLSTSNASVVNTLNVGGSVIATSNIRSIGENTYIGTDFNSVPRLGFVKPNGFGPFIAAQCNNPIMFAVANGVNDFSQVTNFNQLNEYMRISPTGNVGIGTTNPTSKLQVNGTAVATNITVNALTVSNDINTSNINFTGSLLQNGSPYIGSQWITNSSNVYISGSNVAIGKTSATVALDVQGAVAISSNLIVAQTVSAQNINFTGQLLQNGSAYIGSQWTTNTSNVYILGSNIGIGVTNPSTSLHVGCNAIINSNLFVGGTLSVSNLSVPNLTINSNLSVGSNLAIGGNLQMQNQVAFKGIYLTRPNGTTANISTTQGFLQNSNGLFTTSNVGIGTSNPQYNLEVNGTIGVTTGNMTLSSSNNASILFTNGSTTRTLLNAQGFYPNTDNSISLGFSATAQRWSTIYTVNGNFSSNVVIGGSNANTFLQFGNTGLSPRLALYGTDPCTTYSGGGANLHGFGVGGNALDLYVPSSIHAFRFWTSNNNIVTINNTGLGIGTTNPINTLDVIGNVASGRTSYPTSSAYYANSGVRKTSHKSVVTFEGNGNQTNTFTLVNLSIRGTVMITITQPNSIRNSATYAYSGQTTAVIGGTQGNISVSMPSGGTMTINVASYGVNDFLYAICDITSTE